MNTMAVRFHEYYGSKVSSIIGLGARFHEYNGSKVS